MTLYACVALTAYGVIAAELFAVSVAREYRWISLVLSLAWPIALPIGLGWLIVDAELDRRAAARAARASDGAP